MSDKHLRNTLLMRELKDGGYSVGAFQLEHFRPQLLGVIEILPNGFFRLAREIRLLHVDGEQLSVEPGLCARPALQHRAGVAPGSDAHQNTLLRSQLCKMPCASM